MEYFWNVHAHHNFYVNMQRCIFTEMKRYQADISFSMKATRKEIQNFINELIMADF